MLSDISELNTQVEDWHSFRLPYTAMAWEGMEEEKRYQIYD
jgi:hypothetical protein